MAVVDKPLWPSLGLGSQCTAAGSAQTRSEFWGSGRKINHMDRWLERQTETDRERGKERRPCCIWLVLKHEDSGSFDKVLTFGGNLCTGWRSAGLLAQKVCLWIIPGQCLSQLPAETLRHGGGENRDDETAESLLFSLPGIQIISQKLVLSELIQGDCRKKLFRTETPWGMSNILYANLPEASYRLQASTLLMHWWRFALSRAQRQAGICSASLHLLMLHFWSVSTHWCDANRLKLHLFLREKCQLNQWE